MAMAQISTFQTIIPILEVPVSALWVIVDGVLFEDESLESDRFSDGFSVFPESEG